MPTIATVRRALVEHAGLIEPTAPLGRTWRVQLNEDYAYQADLREIVEKVRFLAKLSNPP